MPDQIDLQLAQRLIDEHRTLPGAMLPILHAIQEQFSYVPAEVVPLIADSLNLSRAEVAGVLSYYHFFRQQAPAKHVLQICRAEACQSMGSEALAAHARALLDSSGADVTLEPVYCLGQCGCAPAILLDEQLYGRVTAERLAELINRRTS